MVARGLRSIAGLCAAIVMMAASGTARADVNDRGFYLGFRALAALAVFDDEAIAGGPGGAFGLTDDSPEATIGTGFLAGYHWQRHGVPIRTEIEYAYRLRADFDTVAAGPPRTGFKDNLSTHSLMFNTYLDFDTGTPWRPYLGVGIGWARNQSETLRTNIVSGARQEIKNDTDGFAYSVQAGVRVAITRWWVAELGYRYIDLGEIDSGRFTIGDTITADSHVSHDFILGFAYLF